LFGIGIADSKWHILGHIPATTGIPEGATKIVSLGPSLALPGVEQPLGASTAGSLFVNANKNKATGSNSTVWMAMIRTGAWTYPWTPSPQKVSLSTYSAG